MVRIERVVPKEWCKYAPLGAVIPRTRFIVFKTPLNDRLLTKVPKEHHFTTFHLYRMLAERGLRLGMVVDLTDTERYYNRKEIEGMCIDYEKIFCPGRGFVEREEITEQFNAAIEKFTAKYEEDKDLLIGVHCTHGVNRSGYLICRFLIERLGWSSHDAIEAFERARGYPIEKGAYIQALHRAAKEARNRRLRQSDSDNDSEAMKKKKHKKNKKKQRDEAENDMGSMLQQFFGQLGHHAQQLEEGASGSNYDSPANGAYDSPSQSLQNVAASVTSYPGEAGEADSPFDGEPDEGEMLEGGDDESAQQSRARKRRERKRKHEEMLKVMKRGNFHEIQEIIQKRFGEQ